MTAIKTIYLKSCLIDVEVMLRHSTFHNTNLQAVASGDFLLSHYHLFSYLDRSLLRSPTIIQPFDLT